MFLSIVIGGEKLGYYQNATICLNGHAASSTTANYRRFCKDCGVNTISQCDSCDTYIQGDYEVPGIAVIGFTYYPPAYCHNCGQAYPWTKVVLENAVELISLDDELPSEHKKIIKNAFPDLVVETPTTPVAVAKYKKYMSKSAEYVQEGMRNLLKDVVSETVKKSIWG